MRQDMLPLIASHYGTPTYVFDMQNLSKRVALLRSKLPAGTQLCFAMKANPFLAGALSRLTDKLEVCSPGEYEICIREQIDPEKLVVSGVSKTRESMERILSYSHGAGIYTIESELHYTILRQCADRLDRRLKILLRLSSGNQFGMDEDTLERVLTMIQTDNCMDVIGIHYYSGTQKKEQKIEQELQRLDAYGKQLVDKYNLNGLELEYGPGLMVSYFENASTAELTASDENHQLDMLNHSLSDITSYQHISIELGRFLAWDCGYYMTQIMDIKHTAGTGFVIVDGGIHHINYYEQMMGMKKPYMQIIRTKDTPGNVGKWTICGSLCTVNDVLVRQAELDVFDIGDILVFERCGAYAVTEGMALFLSRELPQVLLVDTDGNIQILRNQTQINVLNGRMEETEHGRIN